MAVAVVGGVLTVASNEVAGADTPPAVDTLTIVSGAGLTPPASDVVCRTTDIPTYGTTLSTAQLCGPSGVATDSSGNVYVVDSGHDEVDKFSASGTLLATFGSRNPAIALGQPGHPFNEPVGVAVDSNTGNIFIANTDDDTIYEVVGGSGTPVRIAGISGDSQAVAGTNPLTSPIPFPQAIAVDPSGNLYVSTGTTPGTQIVKITNPGPNGGTLSNVISTQLSKVTGIAYDPIDGSLILADWNNSASLVEKLSSPNTSPVLSVLAGTGPAGAPIPGPATSSPLNRPSGVSVDKYGNIFIVEYGDGSGGGARVDKIDTSGNLTVLSGNGTDGFPVNGAPAAGQALGDPFGIAVDAGNAAVYVTNASKSGQLIKIALVANPSAPTNLVATAGNNSIGLSFNIPADSGYTAVTGYQVSINGGNWATLLTTNLGGTQTASLPGANGTTYSIAVRALNALGASPSSNVVSVTPAAPAPIVVKPAPPVVAPAPVLAPSAPIAPAKAVAPWFKDPLTAAQRRTEIAVPRSPVAYKGAIKWTVATDKSRNGTVAIPVLSIRGRVLAPHQAATLSGDNLFRGNTATLTGAALVQLRSLVTSLKGAKTITCEGYTDYSGNSKQLQTLSAQRALAVCNALKAGGAKVRTSTVGYGIYRPVILGGKPANRAANRRIVVLVTS